MIFRIKETVILTSLVALSACAPQSPNEWMPRGYTYNDNTPISSPAPTSPWLKEAEISDTNKLAASTAAWQGAAFELIDGLSTVLPTDGSPINVMEKPPVTNHDLALDHYTRQALMQKGITLTTTNGIGLSLSIDTAPLARPEILEEAKALGNFDYAEGMDVKDSYLLSATLSMPDGMVLGESKTVAALPYEKAEYARLPGFSTRPASGLSTDKSPVYNQ